MGAPIPVPVPPSGVVVTWEQIYAEVRLMHDTLRPLAALPEVVAGQEKRLRSLENWRLFLLGAAAVSFGTASASLFQLPLLGK